MGVRGQVLSTSIGTGIYGGVQEDTYSVAIKVNSLDFANVENGSPATYNLDEIRVSPIPTIRQDSLAVLKAGIHFGFGMGNEVGVIADLVVELAAALNNQKMGIKAIVDPDDNTRVLIAPHELGDSLGVSVACFSYRLIGGNAPFTIEDIDGTLLFSSETEDKSVGFVVARSKEVTGLQLI
jgi:hypothetical protein